LLDARFNFVGIGVTWGADGTLYVVQDFMELAGSAPAAPVPTAAPVAASPPARTSTLPPRRAPAPPPAAPVRRAPAAPAPATSPLPPPPPLEPSLYLTSVLTQLRAFDA
jgi:hypothetical protein